MRLFLRGSPLFRDCLAQFWPLTCKFLFSAVEILVSRHAHVAKTAPLLPIGLAVAAEAAWQSRQVFSRAETAQEPGVYPLLRPGPIWARPSGGFTPTPVEPPSAGHACTEQARHHRTDSFISLWSSTVAQGRTTLALRTVEAQNFLFFLGLSQPKFLFFASVIPAKNNRLLSGYREWWSAAFNCGALELWGVVPAMVYGHRYRFGQTFVRSRL